MIYNGNRCAIAACIQEAAALQLRPAHPAQATPSLSVSWILLHKPDGFCLPITVECQHECHAPQALGPALKKGHQFRNGAQAHVQCRLWVSLTELGYARMTGNHIVNGPRLRWKLQHDQQWMSGCSHYQALAATIGDCLWQSLVDHACISQCL